MRAKNYLGVNLPVWEKACLAVFLLVLPFLTFYHLKYSPKPWHDEGSAMLLAKTLVEDHVYAIHSSDGYQTFGAVQSIGPTVILPVTLSFKLFGVGIMQGRIVMALALLLTLALFYILSRKLFGPAVAVLAMLLLLGAPRAAILYYGRQVLGEAPAFGFFIAGWVVWVYRDHLPRVAGIVLMGLMFGFAMVTKSTYTVIVGGELAALIFLDLVYYKLGNAGKLFMVGVVAGACFAGWEFFQYLYFGAQFKEGLALMGQLASSVTGFKVQLFPILFKYFIGVESGFFFFWLGIPALIYAMLFTLKKDQTGFAVAGLVLFVAFWLLYYFYNVPWLSYLMAPVAMSAMFVAKLLVDVYSSLGVFDGNPSLPGVVGAMYNQSLRLSFVSLVVLIALYSLQGTLRLAVFKLDMSPYQVAEYLDQNVSSSVVIETWERELGMLTDHPYHYPDQANLIGVHAALYKGVSSDYVLGAEYFEKYKPGYVIVGPFAQEFKVYDSEYLNQNGKILTSIESAGSRYDIYQLSAHK